MAQLACGLALTFSQVMSTVIVV
jgi:hypothetical protein